MALSFFSLELCLRFDPTLTAALTPLLRKPEDRQSHGELWTLWTQAARHLVRRKAAWVSGCWELWDDDAKANSMYPDWSEGLTKEKGARRGPSGGPDPYRGSPDRFMTVTMACLMRRGAVSERAMASVCDISEAFLWHRSSFERILGGIANINFAIVERAVLYTVPRDDDWALTPEDMRDPKFQYLRPIL